MRPREMAPSPRLPGGTYPVRFGNSASEVAISEGGAGDVEGGAVPPAVTSTCRCASRSLHVGLLPASARRGGPPEGLSVESVRIGAVRS